MDFSSLTVFSCFLTPGQPFISPGSALGTACSPCSQGMWAGCEVGYPALAEHLHRYGVWEWDSHRGDMQGQRTASISFNHVILEAEQQRSWHEWV